MCELIANSPYFAVSPQFCLVIQCRLENLKRYKDSHKGT